MDTIALKRIPLFGDATDEELRKVAAFALTTEVADGTVVIEEGRPSEELMAIKSGTAEVTRDGKHVADLGPGDVFGEAGILDDEPRNPTITATSRLQLISMDHIEVKRLKEDSPEVYGRVQALAEERRSKQAQQPR